MRKSYVIIFCIISVFIIGIFYSQSRKYHDTDVDENKHTAMPTAEMKERLSPEAFNVMYKKGTEPPFTSAFNNEHRKGTYVTADSRLPVFRSEDKYDSGTGWPSFTKAIDENIYLREDVALGILRLEVISRDTGAHLGHVFDDGPLPSGKRYCMNGIALVFVPDLVQ